MNLQRFAYKLMRPVRYAKIVSSSGFFPLISQMTGITFLQYSSKTRISSFPFCISVDCLHTNIHSFNDGRLSSSLIDFEFSSQQKCGRQFVLYTMLRNTRLKIPTNLSKKGVEAKHLPKSKLVTFIFKLESWSEDGKIY